MATESGKFHVYHIEDGKIVMDKADHLEHFKHARAAMGLPKARIVAGTFSPLAERYHTKYEAHFKASFDHKSRKQLPEFVEPAHWPRLKERHAKARAAREAKR